LPAVGGEKRQPEKRLRSQAKNSPALFKNLSSIFADYRLCLARFVGNLLLLIQALIGEGASVECNPSVVPSNNFLAC